MVAVVIFFNRLFGVVRRSGPYDTVEMFSLWGLFETRRIHLSGTSWDASPNLAVARDVSPSPVDAPPRTAFLTGSMCGRFLLVGNAVVKKGMYLWRIAR